MNESDLKVGDIVMLKTGDGPAMVIAKINSDKADCVWFYNMEPKEHTFNPTALRKYNGKIKVFDEAGGQ